MSDETSAGREHWDIADFFDDYVRNIFPARRAAAQADWAWPGDEWADQALREGTFSRIVGNRQPSAWREVVEFGPGAGKYTAEVLAASPAHVSAYEISGGFVDVLQRRFPAEITAGRLSVTHVDWKDNEGLLARFRGRAASADLVFAIDVFMMMDFQSVLVYLLTAANMLKPGGRLVATFADGVSESGWTRMLRDVGRHSAFDPSPCTRFHWVTGEMLENVLPKLGFGDVRIDGGPENGLDIARLYLDATLVDASLPEALASNLKPAGDSTNVKA